MQVVGIISDTHCKLPNEALAALRGSYDNSQVVERLLVDCVDGAWSEGDPVPDDIAPLLEPAPCDLIVHAGDVGNSWDHAQWVLDALGEVAPVKAVLGNCDPDGIYEIEGRPVQRHAAFEVAGITFGVAHEPERLRAAINGNGPIAPPTIKPKPRVRIHGHTHEPALRRMGEGVQVCPGSVSRPSGRRKDPTGWYKSIAIVRIGAPGELLSAEIVMV